MLKVKSLMYPYFTLCFHEQQLFCSVATNASGLIVLNLKTNGMLHWEVGAWVSKRMKKIINF